MDFKVQEKGVGYVIQVLINGVKFESCRDFENENEAQEFINKQLSLKEGKQ